MTVPNVPIEVCQQAWDEMITFAEKSPEDPVTMNPELLVLALATYDRSLINLRTQWEIDPASVIADSLGMLRGFVVTVKAQSPPPEAKPEFVRKVHAFYDYLDVIAQDRVFAKGLIETWTIFFQQLSTGQ